MALCNITAHQPNAASVGVKLGAIPALVRLLGYGSDRSKARLPPSAPPSSPGTRLPSRELSRQLAMSPDAQSVSSAAPPSEAAYVDPIVTRNAAMALANLTSADTSCQDLAVASKGLEPLVALASALLPPPPPQSPNRDPSRRQTFALASPLSSGASVSSRGSSLALLPPGSPSRPVTAPPPERPPPDKDAVRYAGLALSNLTTNRKHRVDIVRWVPPTTTAQHQ